MMKTLFLVRHAKASRDDPSLSDRDRPLTERGLDDASAMGERLARRSVKPDRLVSSPALRALTTAQLIADGIGWARDDIVVDDRLYGARVEDLIAVVRATAKSVDRLMLFGHNPEFSELASRLAGKPLDLSTCAMAEFVYDTTSWSDVGALEPQRSKLAQP